VLNDAYASGEWENTTWTEVAGEPWTYTLHKPEGCESWSDQPSEQEDDQ
jgi:hypothetical protein